MTAKVMLIGLDAADALVIDQYIAKGYMPNFARLASDGASRDLKGCLETLPGSVWPEICTGTSCGRLGEFYHPGQLISGETRIRPLRAGDLNSDKYFWKLASDAGKRVVAIDIPQSVPVDRLNGISIHEWGLHDRVFETESDPPELLEELHAKYGDHPVQKRACDTLAGQEGYETLREKLIAGLQGKTDMAIDILDREDWDLFICTIGETHCAGHQFWGLQDPKSPHYPKDAPPVWRTAMRDIYQEADRAIGRLIDAAGPDADVYVLASHGMGPYIGGPQLLREVLIRLGMSGHKDRPAKRKLRHLHNLARKLPWSIKRNILRPLVNVGWVRGLQRQIDASLDPFESHDTLAAPVRNNRCGAIRLNLKGRDPMGCVEPGAEEGALLDQLKRELYSLRDPETKQPIIAEIKTAAEAFGQNIHPNTPDLMIVFRTDLGALEACESARVGLVTEPINSPGYPRTGDHRPVCRLWHLQAEPWNTHAETASTLDIAPTLLKALGLPRPAFMDGEPLT